MNVFLYHAFLVKCRLGKRERLYVWVETGGVLAFVHGLREGVLQAQLVIFEGVDKVLQDLQAMAVSTLTLPDEDGVHDRKLIALAHEAVAQAICGKRMSDLTVLYDT